MTREEIRTHLNAIPFKPVKLITSSGKSYLVPEPNFVAFSPSGRTCLAYADDGEFFTQLDVETITDVVPVKRRPRGRKKG
jgi:hypothetical protein